MLGVEPPEAVDRREWATPARGLLLFCALAFVGSAWSQGQSQAGGSQVWVRREPVISLSGELSEKKERFQYSATSFSYNEVLYKDGDPVGQILHSFSWKEPPVRVGLGKEIPLQISCAEIPTNGLYWSHAAYSFDGATYVSGDLVAGGLCPVDTDPDPGHGSPAGASVVMKPDEPANPNIPLHVFVRAIVRGKGFGRSAALHVDWRYDLVGDAPPTPPAEPPESPGAATLEFLDANPQFVKTDVVTWTGDKAARVMALVLARTRREGTVADGISLLLLRAEVPGPGTGFFSVEGTDANGTVIPLGQDLWRSRAGTRATVQAEPVPNDTKRYFVFCLYRPPDSFGAGRSDRSFEVGLEFTPESGAKVLGKKELKLARPPVVLVHGTFDNPKYCWETKDIEECVYPMRSALLNEGFRVFAVDWHETNGQKNPSSFVRNRRAVSDNPGGITNAVGSLRAEGFAATAADVVGHSQGGVIARVYAEGGYGADSKCQRRTGAPEESEFDLQCGYHSPETFRRGNIHRLITISATHYGSDICSLFKEYQKLVEEKAWVGDKNLSILKGWQTELILCLHPQREFIVENDPIQFLNPYEVVCAIYDHWYGGGTTPRSGDYGPVIMLWNGFLEKMSPFRERAFTEGVRDQTPGSDALKAIGQTRIPSHAIACVASDDNMLKLNKGYYQQRLELMWGLSGSDLLRESFRRLGQSEDGEDLYRRKEAELRLDASIRKISWRKPGVGKPPENLGEFGPMTKELAKMIQLNAARLRAAVFGNAPNDCTVRLASSFGGLPTEYTTMITNALHGPAPQYPDVQRRVVELLKDDGKVFCRDGFPPAGERPPAAPYRGPEPTEISQWMSVFLLGLKEPQPDGPEELEQNEPMDEKMPGDEGAKKGFEDLDSDMQKAMASGKLDEALTIAKQLATRQTKEPMRRMDLAAVYMAKGMNSEAIDAVKAAIQLAPGDAMIVVSAAEMMVQLDQRELAKATVAEGIRRGLDRGEMSRLLKSMGLEELMAAP